MNKPLKIRVSQQPAGDPVSLTEAALHCRVDSTSDHPALQSMIKAATRFAEQYLGRPILTRSYQQFFEEFPDCGFLELRRSPLVSVTHLKTYDDSDTATTFSSSNYYVDTVASPGRLVLRAAATWPSYDRVANPIEVEYRAGFGAGPGDIPGDIRQAVLMLVANLYEHRGDMSESPARESALELLSAYKEVMI